MFISIKSIIFEKYLKPKKMNELTKVEQLLQEIIAEQKKQAVYLAMVGHYQLLNTYLVL